MLSQAITGHCTVERSFVWIFLVFCSNSVCFCHLVWFGFAVVVLNLFYLLVFLGGWGFFKLLLPVHTGMISPGAKENVEIHRSDVGKGASITVGEL